MDPQNLNFGQALEALLAGEHLTREGWNGPHYIALQKPDEHSANRQPYIYIVPHGDLTLRIPWTASQADIFANDWAVALK